jgi:hypothetical protein
MSHHRAGRRNYQGANSLTGLLSTADLVRYEKQMVVEMALRDQRIRLRAMLIGQWSALLVTLCLMCCSTFLVATGHEISGTILGTVDLVALAGRFLPGPGAGVDAPTTDGGATAPGGGVGHQ